MATTSFTARNKAKARRRSRLRRHARVRKSAFGSPNQPRLAVFRSSRHIYAQLIDDVTGQTIAAASTVEPGQRELGGTKKDAAKRVGQLVAERAVQKGVERVAFDRGGYQYHGRVAALADGAREGGLRF